MRITAAGWRRDMGENSIGDTDLESAILLNEHPKTYRSSEVYIISMGEYLQVLWKKEVTLNGNYLIMSEFKKVDVFKLMKAIFGNEITIEDLESAGITLSSQGFADKLAEMPVGDLFRLLKIKDDEIE